MEVFSRRVNAACFPGVDAGAKRDTMFRPANNFMLWVDAVGGFRVCLRDEVTLGQPVQFIATSSGSVVQWQRSERTDGKTGGCRGPEWS